MRWASALQCRVVPLAIAACLASRVGAQTVPASAKATDDVRTVDGRVRRPVAQGLDTTDMGPAANTWVTVHRVGPDSAGPLDSVRSDASGHYRLRWRTFGNTDAMYFASVTWHGIAYFTPPLRDRNTRGDAAEITVFDTTSRTFPLHIKGRHVIVSAPDSTHLCTVIEVFELENDSLRTLVSPATRTAAATWSVRIPTAAQDVHATEGEISKDAFSAVSGRVSVFAPMAPGIKQVSFSYRVPSGRFPLSIPIDADAVVVEVLLEDAQGRAQGAGMVAVDPVTMENRTFRRFLAQDVRAGSSLVLRIPNGRGIPRKGFLVAVLLTLGSAMLLALGMRTRTTPVPTVPVAPPRARDALASERLAQEIAMLDVAHARASTNTNVSASATPHDPGAHAVRRATLMAALRAALADEAPSG